MNTVHIVLCRLKGGHTTVEGVFSTSEAANEVVETQNFRSSNGDMYFYQSWPVTQYRSH